MEEAKMGMTIDEAINHLGNYSSTNGSGLTTDKQHNEAKRVAIDIMRKYQKLAQEPTTKNDLGVDAVSRKDVHDMLENLPITVEDKWFNWLQKACMRLADLPSVTLQESRWIPVSDSLPNTDDEVLCWYEYYHWSQEKVLPEYGFGQYFKEMKAWFGEVATGKDVRVIAWMPLPPHYSEKGGKNGET